jgi:hypothetical protein
MIMRSPWPSGGEIQRTMYLAGRGSAAAGVFLHGRGWRPVRDRGPEHRSIVVVDMMAFGRWHNPSQLRARAVLRAVLRSAFRSAGITWRRVAVEDRGDGMIILVPPTVSKADILDPIIPNMATMIRQHNVACDAESRIRLRVSVHAGEVHADPAGWVGTDLNVACRLLDSPAAYRHLRRDPSADLVVVVSNVIYHGIVQHRYRRISPAAYIPIHVTIKEVNTRAWLHAPMEATPVDSPHQTRWR